MIFLFILNIKIEILLNSIFTKNWIDEVNTTLIVVFTQRTSLDITSFGSFKKN